MRGKKTIIIILLLFHITIFSSENLGVKTKYIITNNEIIKLLNSNKKDILKNEGKYSLIQTGAEGSFEGYVFIKKGIIIVFEYDGSVKYIECMENLKYNEVSVGMTFDEIINKLGNAKINKNFYESEENTEYELYYNFEKFAIQFTSTGKKEKTNSMLIIKGVSKREINEKWISKMLKMKKNELEKEIGKTNKIYKADYEGYKNAYYYEKLGISIIYNKKNEVEYIEIENKKEIFQIMVGLSFEELKKIYINSAVKKNKVKMFNEEEEEIIYEIKKNIDDFTLQFWSYDKNSSNTFLRIYKTK